VAVPDRLTLLLTDSVFIHVTRQSLTADFAQVAGQLDELARCLIYRLKMITVDVPSMNCGPSRLTRPTDSAL